MCIPDLPNLVLVILGPTAVGKTAISMQLARMLSGEIISADSSLFYRGMDIGTAKPSKQELQSVRHHLIDVSFPDEPWSLAVYQQRANEVIQEIQSRKRLPILVGGTGQYIWSILEGWSIPKQEPEYQLREVLENWGNQMGPAELHKRLSILDAESARCIDSRNTRRVVRALEVILRTGQKFSDQRKKVGTPNTVLVIGLIRPRQELYERIDQRINEMIEKGLVSEVETLLKSGYSATLSAFSAIGYRQIIQYLDGVFTLDEAVNEMRKLTRQFVRRQHNWFKPDDERINWISFQNEIVKEILTVVSNQERWLLPDY